MKMLFVVLLFVGGTVGALSQSESQLSDQLQVPFSIVISPKRQIVTVGTGVSLRIRVTNRSNHNLSLSSAYFDGVDISYQQNVWDDIGNSAKEREQSERAVHMRGHSIIHTLKPGESANSATEISRVYDMNQPGRYTIQLSRPVSDNPKDGMAKSNKITVTVTD